MSGENVTIAFAQWFAANAHRFEYPLAPQARQALWECADGWIVGYTTSRVTGGEHEGRFLAMSYKPVGPGARSGRAGRHVLTYCRTFSSRRSAKARAEALYHKHTPTGS